MKASIIDTDILSYFLKGDEKIRKKVINYLFEYPALNLSTITCFEVLNGLAHKEASRQIQDFEKFLLDCNVINISDKSIRLSAYAGGFLKRKGITIGNSDLLIAGIALEHGLTLIINNTRHFEKIPDLEIDNWK